MNTAEKIIDKFGGQTALAELIQKRQSTVGYWAKSGMIPSKWHRQLLLIARANNIELSPSEFQSD